MENKTLVVIYENFKIDIYSYINKNISKIFNFALFIYHCKQVNIITKIIYRYYFWDKISLYNL